MITFTSHIDGYHDVADQMAADLRRRAADYFRVHEKEKAALRRVADFEARRERMRGCLLDALGGLPNDRTPLKARVSGTVDCDQFVVEKLIYESVPNFPVTAACYVPKKLRRRTPAVVFLCGHWDLGKMQPSYQSVCIDLANNGFIVLAIDPLGQGERSQYFDQGRRTVGSACFEHTHAGFPFVLQGASEARHFVWDVIRGIDYLATRSDVDMARIGITGNSGGGTQTCLTLLCEPRIAGAVACTFVTSLETYLQTGQPQDAEQIVPNCMAMGLDHDDFLTAIAPKPVLVGAAAYDYFPIEGTLESVRRARAVYALYGREQNLGLVVDPTVHTYSAGLRGACVNWFRKHFLDAPDGKAGPTTPSLLPESALWATVSGQVVVDFPAAKTVYDLGCDLLRNRRGAQTGVPRRSVATRKKIGSRTGAALRDEIERVLGVSQGGDRAAPIYPRVISTTVVDNYPVEKLFFFSAPDVIVTALVIHPSKGDGKKPLPTTLLLLENGTSDAVRERERIEKLLAEQRRVCVLDVRGIGAVEARPVTPTSSKVAATFNTEYRLGCDAAMLGISTVGLRVFDVLRAFDYLKSRADCGAISLEGVGSGATFAYFAAALEPGFESVTVVDLLVSYRLLCETRDYDHDKYNWKMMARGILGAFDVADLMPCLHPRPVTFVDPRDARGDVLGGKELKRVFLGARMKGKLPANVTAKYTERKMEGEPTGEP